MEWGGDKIGEKRSGLKNIRIVVDEGEWKGEEKVWIIKEKRGKMKGIVEGWKSFVVWRRWKKVDKEGKEDFNIMRKGRWKKLNWSIEVKRDRERLKGMKEIGGENEVIREDIRIGGLWSKDKINMRIGKLRIGDEILWGIEKM